jgi:hypothetical protein
MLKSVELNQQITKVIALMSLVEENLNNKKGGGFLA